MQVTETFSEGLKRKLEIVVEAKELDGKLQARLEQLKDTVRIKGFRPGKVPVAHLRRVYGEQVMAEVVQQTIQESIKKTLDDRSETPAYNPDITITEDEEEIKNVFSGKSDLEIKLAFEVLPQIELSDFSELSLEKEVAEVSEKEIEDSLEKIAKGYAKYEDKDGPAEDGDQITVDFVGKIDGEPFEGGSAEDAVIVIGRKAFIPGFEEGLIGLKAEQEHNLELTFPENYSAEHLAGKNVVFSVKVKKVESPLEQTIDDEFAKSLGLESLDQLKETVEKELKQQHEEYTKEKLKRDVLDKLNESYAFELPPTLVMQEFDAVWKQVTDDLEKSGKSFEDNDATEEKEREKYYSLAERRVRMGLLLKEIGEQNEIKVSEEEVRGAMLERARQFPGQERQILELYQKNPQAVAQLQAPIFEDKIITLIVEQAKVTEREVTAEELFDLSEE